MELTAQDFGFSKATKLLPPEIDTCDFCQTQLEMARIIVPQDPWRYDLTSDGYLVIGNQLYAEIKGSLAIIGIKLTTKVGSISCINGRTHDLWAWAWQE